MRTRSWGIRGRDGWRRSRRLRCRCTPVQTALCLRSCSPQAERCTEPRQCGCQASDSHQQLCHQSHAPYLSDLYLCSAYVHKRYYPRCWLSFYRRKPKPFETILDLTKYLKGFEMSKSNAQLLYEAVLVLTLSDHVKYVLIIVFIIKTYFCFSLLANIIFRL